MDAAGRDAAADVEIEIKLAVLRPDVIRALLDEPDPKRLADFEPAGPPSENVVTDRYVDTDLGVGALRAAGLRARLRHGRDGVVLAVKGRGAIGVDGVTTRMELEGPATPDPDPLRWPASPARARLVEMVAGAKLIEIAAIRQRRRVRLLRRGSTVIELSLDELSALDGESVLATRVELEAELKSGPADALSDLAAALAAIDGLAPPLGSKLEFALGARRER